MNSSVLEKSQITKLCLIAGEGQLPILLAKQAVADGVDLTVFSLSKENFKDLEKITRTFPYSPFEVFKMIEHIKALSIKYLTFIGKVPKSLLFKNLHKIDRQLLSKINELKNLNDDSLHWKLAELLEKEHGLSIIDQTIFLKSLFPGPQTFTQRQASETERQEAEYGLKMAKGIAALDIGQTVIVQNKSVIAVEAIEGTNRCIKRAQKFNSGFLNFTKPQSIMVCKVSKPNQDQRFDVPTVGINTIKAMPKNSILVIEANEVFFPSQEESIALADAKNICVFAI